MEGEGKTCQTKEARPVCKDTEETCVKTASSYLCPESEELVSAGGAGPITWPGDGGNMHSTRRDSPCSC